MSNFANIRLPEGYMVDPSLALLVDTLALRYPTFTFTTKGWDKDTLVYFSSATPRLKQPKPAGATDDTRYMLRLQVYAGEECLGMLALDTRYPRGGGNVEGVYLLKTWRLGKRDTRTGDTLKTSKLNVALREFKKYFIPRVMSEAFNDARDEILHGLNSSLNTLKRAIANNAHTPNHVDMQRYLYLSLNNIETGFGLKKLMDDVFTSDKYKEAMANYMLAKHMEKFVLLPVIGYQGGYLYSPSEVKEIQHLTYEELPEDTQTSVAILQLCKDNEVVRDVGFRLKDGRYAIIQRSIAT